MGATMLSLFLKYTFIVVAVALGLYLGLLGLLTTPSFQAHVVYLHKIQMTWSKNLNVPESFGFLRGQVTPFSIKSPDGQSLFAWHILPVELYRQHEADLVAEPAGFVSDSTSRAAFNLLRNDPDARLVIHMHGAAGTIGSGYRVPNYRALSAGQPSKIHVLTFDYRGFGYSSGSPSERGLCLDATAVVEWAMNVAGIPSSRILIVAQSIGTAVALAVSEHFALQSPSIVFAGTLLIAPFIDVATLVATYSVAGTIPIISPLAKYPRLFSYLRTFIKDRWSSKDRISGYIRAVTAASEKYQLTLIHARDDWDIPYIHTQKLFRHAVDATVSQELTDDEFELATSEHKQNLGAAGSVVDWRTDHGIIREEILETGLHDVVMGNPVVSLATMRLLVAADPSFK
ncbi:uncharacterized protein KY384_005800 [Bacidia gigantensis]|uniref:uncharacterized protein n=1 Tax=Bacidia gigantensis TaxID=2732470 RepID=UPI001D05ABC9|nr:uncharacterized protein KY384_005800 [Bacidia gigantensis]KAG8529165.1 hypothetical protein KY384_005800 [Bacidia gigantensis]